MKNHWPYRKPVIANTTVNGVSQSRGIDIIINGQGTLDLRAFQIAGTTEINLDASETTKLVKFILDHFEIETEPRAVLKADY